MTGSGKTYASDYFFNHGYHFIRFGQVVLDEVKRKGLLPTEKNEKKVREDLRKEHGMDAIARLNLENFKKLLRKGNVVADGLYSWSEYKFLKKIFGTQMVVIAVFAPPKLRYERLVKRKLKKSDKDYKNRPATKEYAQKRDYAEIEKIEKGGPIAMADYMVLNTKDEKYLKNQLNEVRIDLEKNLK